MNAPARPDGQGFTVMRAARLDTTEKDACCLAAVPTELTVILSQAHVSVPPGSWVRTVLQCAPLVYLDQAVCPPAPAIITHPALLSMAPASAGKAGRVLTAPSSAPAVRGVWPAIRHAYVATELHVTL